MILYLILAFCAGLGQELDRGVSLGAEFSDLVYTIHLSTLYMYSSEKGLWTRKEECFLGYIPMEIIYT